MVNKFLLILIFSGCARFNTNIEIRPQYKNPKRLSYCSATVINPRLILTANHCTMFNDDAVIFIGEKRFLVTRSHYFQRSVLGGDEGISFFLLDKPITDSVSKPDLGWELTQKIYLNCWVKGEEIRKVGGINYRHGNMYWTNIKIEKGCSGGAVRNELGEIIGVMSAMNKEGMLGFIKFEKDNFNG